MDQRRTELKTEKGLGKGWIAKGKETDSIRIAKGQKNEKKNDEFFSSKNLSFALFRRIFHSSFFYPFSIHLLFVSFPLRSILFPILSRVSALLVNPKKVDLQNNPQTAHVVTLTYENPCSGDVYRYRSLHPSEDQKIEQDQVNISIQVLRVEIGVQRAIRHTLVVGATRKNVQVALLTCLCNGLLECSMCKVLLKKTGLSIQHIDNYYIMQEP